MTRTRARRPATWPAVAVTAALAVGAATAGCGSDSRQNVEDNVRSAVTDAEASVRSVVTDVADFADQTARSAVELAARNFASIQGTRQFAAAGHPLSANLTCTAEVQESMTEISIDCTGTTDEGSAAELTGSTSELPGASLTDLEGTFTGTVDGDEVFSTDRLGG